MRVHLSFDSFGHGEEADDVRVGPATGVGKATGGEGAPARAAASTSPKFSKNGGSWGELQTHGVRVTTGSGRRIFVTVKSACDTCKLDEVVSKVIKPAVAPFQEDTSSSTEYVFYSDLTQETPINVHDELNALLVSKPAAGEAGANGLFPGDESMASDQTKMKFDMIDFKQDQTQIDG